MFSPCVGQAVDAVDERCRGRRACRARHSRRGHGRFGEDADLLPNEGDGRCSCARAEHAKTVVAQRMDDTGRNVKHPRAKVVGARHPEFDECNIHRVDERARIAPEPLAEATDEPPQACGAQARQKHNAA